MKNGIIISFEGPDGAGKTTVLEKVIPVLEEKGYDIVTTREPGGVEIAERIRDVILDVKHVAMDSKTELLLYMAARRQHYVEKVLPALEAGKVVLIDRFIDSSIAYQGAGRGLPRRNEARRQPVYQSLYADDSYPYELCGDHCDAF